MSHESHDRISRWVMLPRPVAEVWAAVGGFGAIADWHPAVTESPLFDIESATHRHLTLADGGLATERLIEIGDAFYRYAVIETPFPMADAVGALSCKAEAEGCRVYWSLDFQPTDAAADDIAAGFIETGLRSLRERFGG
jgi:hypothetical protein